MKTKCSFNSIGTGLLIYVQCFQLGPHIILNQLATKPTKVMPVANESFIRSDCR